METSTTSRCQSSGVVPCPSFTGVNTVVHDLRGQNRVDQRHHRKNRGRAQRENISLSAAFQVFPNPFQLKHSVPFPFNAYPAFFVPLVQLYLWYSPHRTCGFLLRRMEYLHRNTSYACLNYYNCILLKWNPFRDFLSVRTNKLWLRFLGNKTTPQIGLFIRLRGHALYAFIIYSIRTFVI